VISAGSRPRTDALSPAIVALARRPFSPVGAQCVVEYGDCVLVE
jgi:hypothetical protein